LRFSQNSAGIFLLPAGKKTVSLLSAPTIEILVISKLAPKNPMQESSSFHHPTPVIPTKEESDTARTPAIFLAAPYQIPRPTTLRNDGVFMPDVEIGAFEDAT
jgi:hypothetical protein